MISQDKLNRINELSHKSKQQGLSMTEQKEQQKLRQEYLKNFRNSFKSQLKGMKVVDPEGNDVTPEKLKEEQARNKKH
ncbi:DUF896 domain-containing protein [Pontibacillus sp. ALD_SL1]|uniref:DUF896 domain-containing protein n=1 Tax=Pontibacillus sp. ALD_SL1 TaxID=2777185 RepID=UPI001A96A8A7|nr:DUF896 domain-containing protein [Pontibacillus sp. ALD_SL1]QST01674.1 DUF896 domain-containing protein [Pontibacillus sp. ALD_SL1]